MATASVSTLTATGPAVEIENETLRVDRWSTSAPAVVQLFARADGTIDAVTLFDRIVQTGALAMSAANTSVDVHLVDREFSRLTVQLGDLLEERFSSIRDVLDRIFLDDQGILQVVLDEYLGEGGSLADMFDPDRRSSAVSRLNEILETHFGGRGSKLYELLDHTAPDSPMHAWHEDLNARLDKLGRQLEDYRVEATARSAADAATAIEREKGTQKGRDFEEIAFDVLDAIARSFGDSVEIMADTPGLGGSKVGDFVVTINPRDTFGRPVRVVFEAKDRSVGLTPMLRELDEAIGNREALIGVAIYSADACAPRGSAPFRECGGRYLCVLDKTNPAASAALELAYRAARYWAVASQAPDDVEIDTDAIREDLAEAATKLKAFADLKRQVTKLHNTMDQGTSGLTRSIDALHGELREVFARLDERLHVNT